MISYTNLRNAARTALVTLNVLALAMLSMKLIWNGFSNDDLMAMMIAIFVGNMCWAFFARKKTPPSR